MYEFSYIRQDKIWKINQTYLKLKQLQMTHKLKYNQQRNVLNQLNELEQLNKKFIHQIKKIINFFFFSQKI